MAFQCAAEQAPSDVEALMSNNRWKEASRAIFLEAKSANKFEWSIPAGQANAGFLDDALDTIAGMHPNTQSSALLALVADVPSIPPKRSVELVQRALALARTMSGKSANYIKSGELAKVALFYSRQRAEPDAKTIFEEALKAAEKGADEDDSGGYRQISEALVRDPKGSRDWMVVLVAKHLQRQGKNANSAFAYRDLAEVAIRHTNRQMASELIESGISAAKNISRESMRKSALEGLANVAVEAGYTKGLPKTSPYTQAIQEARAGNPQRALAIASALSENLYVDHGQELHRRVFDDAVKREDLKTALYLGEHPIRPVSWIQANAWRQIAELQVKKGTKQDAAGSYLRASQTISGSPEAVRYLEEVETTLILGGSMRQNGFEAQGRKTTLGAIAMIDLIPGRRTDDRARAATLLAEALWRYGMYSEAKQQALRAYREASGYSDKNGMEKARLLSGLGQAASTFITKASDQRGERNNSKATK
ncbi:hypothetical protein EWM63_31320 [Pseudoduganella lutea]|uniref:Tetratricopeptide repeat protein n=2 Tax=Pseudoduganella lutea TaxID=321985 RepID=A0A4P6L7A7_9BURK|nr:hypothetical protein EWM63_31320 [Pseudoduganella lutea]